MIPLFYWILNMSLIGSLLALCLLVIRKIKCLPRVLIYALYGIVFLRFLCPVGFTNGLSILNLLPQGMVRSISAPLDTKGVEVTFSNAIQKAEAYHPVTLQSEEWTRTFVIGGVIWSVIAGALLLFYCSMYFVAKKEFAKANLCYDSIYQSSATNVPIVFGLFRQKIILPLELSLKEDKTKYIIAHEKTHCRRHDNLWRMLAAVIACIHWFNPLIWVLFHFFCEDIELACDEATVRSFEEEERCAYAMTLLSMAEKKEFIYAAPFGGGNVKVRIMRVINYRKLSLISLVISILFFIFISVSFLSNR